jgi:hypothetical protein
VSQVSGEAEYRRITYDFPIAAAQMLKRHSPDAVFHYLSGAGAGLESRMMWARVKAEAELELMTSFGAVCWRPGSIDGATSDNAPWLYQTMRPLTRLFSPFRRFYVHGEDIGRAMVLATKEGMRARIIGNREIRDMADRYRQIT